MRASELRVGDSVAWSYCGRHVLTHCGDVMFLDDSGATLSDGNEICDACIVRRVFRDGVCIFDDSKPARAYGDGECIATDVTIDPADHEALRVALADMAKAMVEVATERDELLKSLETRAGWLAEWHEWARGLLGIETLPDAAKLREMVSAKFGELRAELDKERKRHAATIAHFEDRLRRIAAEAATP